MDAESFYSLLFNLYAEQEDLKIEYELDNSFFRQMVSVRNIFTVKVKLHYLQIQFILLRLRQIVKQRLDA